MSVEGGGGPARDIASRPDLIAAAVADKPRGYTFSYSELEQILTGGHERLPLHAVQSAVRAAMHRIEVEQGKVLANVRDVGYRVGHYADHVDQSTHHVRKSRRSLGRAHSKVAHVDLAEVPEQLRGAFVDQADHIQRVARTLGNAGRRRKEHTAWLEEQERRRREDDGLGT